MNKLSATALLDRLPAVVGSIAISIVGLRLRRKRINDRVLNQLSVFKAKETQARELLEQEQLEKLKSLVTFSYNSVEYYKKTFDNAGFHPSQLCSLSDLKLVPIIERQDVSQNAESLTSPHNEAVVHASSSGTTGARLHFMVPEQVKFTMNYAALYQFYSWFGIKPNDRRVTLGARFLGNRASGAIYKNWAENQLLLGVNTLNSRTIEKYVDSIQQFAPTFIQGHPSALRHLVELAKYNKLSLPKVKAVATTGESLTQETRLILESAFLCPVFATYGMGESCIFAGECPQRNGYHIHPSFGIVEALQTQNGTIEAILTGIANYKMPLIRYRPGDLLSTISYEPCQCGCTWPRIMSVEGRTSDILTTEDGKPVLPVQLRSNLGHRFIMPPYTIVQESTANSYRLEVFLDEKLLKNPPTFSKELSYLESIFGKNSRVKISYNTNDDLFKNGAKHKMVVRE